MKYSYDHVLISPEKQIGNHYDSLWELSYIITGAGTRTIGHPIPNSTCILNSPRTASPISESAPFKAGEVILIPPRIWHHWVFDPNTSDRNGNIENISVHISDSFLENISESFPGITDTCLKFRSLSKAILYNGTTRIQIIDLLTQMKTQDSIHRASSILILLQLLTRWNETEIVGTSIDYDIPSIRFDKARIYISCNFSRKITLQEIASYVGMNRSSFCSFFKKHSGKSFITYLNEYRINKACELLHNHKNALSISEISSQTGFSEPAHFIRTFHRLKGCSPSRFHPL